MGDFTNPNGMLLFFPVTALMSIPFTAIVLTLCVRGMVLSNPSRRGRYKVLFTIALVINILLVPAVGNYRWLDADDFYSTFFHFYGYFGNMILYVIASTFARNDRVSAWRVHPVAFIVSIGYVWLVGTISSHFIGSTSNDSMFSTLSSYNPVSFALGIGYALIQFILPAIEYWYVSSNKEKIISTIIQSGAPTQTLDTGLPSPDTAEPQPVTSSMGTNQNLTSTQPPEATPVIHKADEQPAIDTAASQAVLTHENKTAPLEAPQASKPIIQNENPTNRQ